MAIAGSWADGSPLLAIPNYARNNRLNDAAAQAKAGDSSIDYSGGATVGTTGSGSNTNGPASQPSGPRRRFRGGESMVWIKDQP